LIKAGLKGNSSDYYKVIKENKLSGNEIKELLINKKISGKLKKLKLEWSISISNKGECEYKLIYGEKYRKTNKGKCWVDGDALCFQFDESLYDGLKYCAEVYKNPEGSKNKLSEYMYLTDFWLFPFSIME
jgi:hypothetical protein